MKNPRNVLKATTAIVVSLSFLSANAIAAEAGLRDLVLAQNEVLPKQAEGKAKGKEKMEAAAAEEAAEEGSIEQAEEGEQGEEDTAAAEAAEEAEEAAEESVEAAEKAEETAEESAEAAAAAAAAAKQVAQNAAETAEDATLPLTEEEAASEAGAAETTAEEAAATDEAAAEEPAAEATSTEAAESEPTSAETTAEETTATEATSNEATEATDTEATTPTEATEATGAEAAASSETGSGSTAGETTAGSETTAEGEPVMMQSTEESGATAETTSEGTETGSTDETATDTTGQGPSETVEQVSEQQIEQATSSGNDVVIQETTSVEELQAQMQESAVQDVSELDDAEPDEVEEEVITDETSRSSDEEVTTTAAASSSDDNDDDDDDNDIWKYLGAAAAGAAVGALIPALGGRLVQNQGDRMIVERDGEFYVRKDENQLLRQPGVRVQTETFPDGLTRTTVIRDDGSRVVTIRDEGGFILRRTSIAPDGTEYVLIDDSPQQIFSFTNWDDELPPLTIDMPDDRYIVDYSRASDDVLRQTLMAEMVGDVDRTFSLREVRENERVRALVPRIDLDAINFDTGSAAIKQSEARDLAELGTMMREVIEQNPREIFLVEGHTDAVGSNLMNLALSDRRAEAVALALTEYYDIPPENLVVQGYGERYLKEQTEGPSQVNRRATVRRITPLIDRVASNN